jgi:hypothetical protein
MIHRTAEVVRRQDRRITNNINDPTTVLLGIDEEPQTHEDFFPEREESLTIIVIGAESESQQAESGALD